MKLWFIYLLTLIKRKLKSLFLILLIIILITSVTVYFKDKIFKPTVVEGLVGTYQDVDLPEVVNNLLSEGLMKTDKTGSPSANLIESWEVSKDGKEYTLILKNNLKWVDGTKIVSSDVDLKLPDINVSYPDEKTLKINLIDNFSPFLSLLAKPIFKKNSQIGLGPYKISRIQKDIIFVKRLNLVSMDKKMPEVVIKFFPNEKIARNALKLGEISLILGVGDVKDLAGQKTLKLVQRTNFNQIVTIFYNTQDKILSDENFRLALSLGAPSILGQFEAKTSIAPTSWAFNSEVKDYLDNPGQAKNYLKKVENGKDSTITLTTTNSLEDIGERVVDTWKKQGIKAVLRVESGIPQNFQALLIAHNIPSDPDQYSLWHSTQKLTNISQFANPRLDKDLEDGRKSQDKEIRKARYYDFQKVLLDYAPATFLYFPKYNIILRKKVEKKLNRVLPIQLPRFH